MSNCNDWWLGIQDFWLYPVKGGNDNKSCYHILNHEKKRIVYVEVAIEKGEVKNATFYTSEYKEHIYFMLKKQPIYSYILEGNNQEIGLIMNKGSKWECYDCYGNLVCYVSKTSELLFALKHTFLSIFFNNYPSNIAFNPDSWFRFIAKTNQTIIGKFFGSISNLDMNCDVNNMLDKRIALATAIILDCKRNAIKAGG